MSSQKRDSSYTFCKAVSSAFNQTDLKTASAIFAADLGYRHFAYFSIGSGFQSLTNYPTDWTDRYRKNLYNEIDPVVDYSIRNTAIARWNQIYAGAEPEQQAFFHEAQEFEINNGIVIPLGGNGEAHGALALANPEPKHVVRSSLLRFFAVNLHINVRHLRPPGFTEDILDESEARWLLWIAYGMRMSEISEVLGISDRGMRYRMAKIKRKLEASSICHALAIANRSGIIDLSQLNDLN